MLTILDWDNVARVVDYIGYSSMAGCLYICMMYESSSWSHAAMHSLAMDELIVHLFYTMQARGSAF